MTTLEEFKEIEAMATKGPLKADNNLGCKRISAKLYGNHKQAKRTEIAHTVGLPEEEDSANAKLFAISRSALPALIAVAEGMATSMENLKPFFKDYVGQMVISKIPGWQEIDREFQQALAAYEAWKLNIEGEK